MEIVGYGILLAIGFYLMPLIVTIGVLVISGVFSILGSIFGGNRK